MNIPTVLSEKRMRASERALGSGSLLFTALHALFAVCSASLRLPGRPLLSLRRPVPSSRAGPESIVPGVPRGGPWLPLIEVQAVSKVVGDAVPRVSSVPGLVVASAHLGAHPSSPRSRKGWPRSVFVPFCPCGSQPGVPDRMGRDDRSCCRASSIVVARRSELPPRSLADLAPVPPLGWGARTAARLAPSRSGSFLAVLAVLASLTPVPTGERPFAGLLRALPEFVPAALVAALRPSDAPTASNGLALGIPRATCPVEVRVGVLRGCGGHSGRS